MTDKGSESFSNKDEHEKESDQGWERMPKKRGGSVKSLFFCHACPKKFSDRVDKLSDKHESHL